MEIRALSLIFICKAHNHPNHPKIKGRNTSVSLPGPCGCRWIALASFGICSSWISLTGNSLRTYNSQHLVVTKLMLLPRMSPPNAANS